MPSPGPKRMRRTTRRVTAQRKFAQGAYVPPAAAAAPTTPAAVTATTERRDAPAVTNDNNNCVIHNNTSASKLLDIICFTKSHKHLEPVVLVEKLRQEENRAAVTRNSETNVLLTLRNRDLGTKKCYYNKEASSRMHVMVLRTRDQRHAPQKLSSPMVGTQGVAKPLKVPKKMPKKVPQRAPAKRKSTRNDSVENSSEFSLDDNKPLKYFVTSSTANPNTAVPFVGPLPLCRLPRIKVTDCVRSRASTSTNLKVTARNLEQTSRNLEETSRNLEETSLYLKETSRNLEETSINLEETSRNLEDTSTTLYSTSTEEGYEVKPVGDIEEPVGDIQNYENNLMEPTGPDTLDHIKIGPAYTVSDNYHDGIQGNDTTSESSVPKTPDPNVLNTPDPNVLNTPDPNVLNTPDPDVPNTLDRDPSAIVADVLNSSDYNVLDTPDSTFLLDCNVPSTSRINLKTKSRHKVTRLTRAQVTPSPSDSSLGEQTAHCSTRSTWIFDCPAATWQSLQQVTDAPKEVFDSRCKSCVQCKRIEKIMQVTTLLKRQKKIDCSDREMTSISKKYAKTNTGSASGTKCIITDLLPRHPHLMIKIKIHNDQDKQIFTSCLIPRGCTTGGNELDLVEIEELFDKVIVNLSLILGDGPPGTANKKKKVDSFSEDESPIRVPGLDSDDEDDEDGEIVDAPVFYPTLEEFKDPIAYTELIYNKVKKYGICKIVPPDGFIPTCKADDDVRFEVSNQYISRLFHRWGPATRKMSALKASLLAQGLEYNKSVMIEGVELNMPRLYNAVQRFGGLESVLNNKKWGKVADAMKLNKNPFTERKLERIYSKYILPYDTLSPAERHQFLQNAEDAWHRKNKQILKRASNPLHHQKILLGDSEDSDEGDRDDHHEAEDCVKSGPTMNLAQFKKIATTSFYNFFRNKSANVKQIEEEYWQVVTSGTDHVCVNAASIDTGELGLGFTTNVHDEYGKHPWNLKKLSDNPGNVLRSLGPVVGVTVPTLHLGMAYSTSCWHRDPHALPWIEFVHQGPIKIWYGVAESQDRKFRDVTEILNPNACQNKTLWLPSDISMIPPNTLKQHGVRIYRVEQKPGEFVLVMPRAYSCSISTGYTVSESAYFATERWLLNLMNVFTEIRDSCEPTMFAIEQLLKAIVEDESAPITVLWKIQYAVESIFDRELTNRAHLASKGVKVTLIGEADISQETRPSKSKRRTLRQPEAPPALPVNQVPKAWNVQDQDECEICRCPLYLSKVKNIPAVNSMVCLTHAIVLLNKPKYAHVQAADLEMLYAFPTKDIQKTIETLHRRIE